VRQTLTVSAGSWSGYAAGLTETRQWLRDGTPIAGASGRDYTLVGADFGKKISVKVTSTLGGRILKTQTTDATAKVAAAVLATDLTYKVRTADRDKRITVRVTGSRLGYTTVSQTSGAYFAR
jgi:hypothetical protein